MPPANQPLFASDRRSSVHSEERAAQEDDALLGNRQDTRNVSTNRYGFFREVALFTWATIATVLVVILAVLLQNRPPADQATKPTGKRNLIFMVSDGMGPASLSLTRSFRQYQDDLPIDDVLVLDQHLIGSSRTRSSSSLITDSAAGATAFSCGEKSYNGAISVLPDHTPCGTVLEAAKRAGYLTGLVVTTSITDATPASFAAHVNLRDEEDLIAEQEVGHHPLGRVVDLMLGGGRCHFLPNSTRGSCRADNLDVVDLAKEKYGWNYIDSREDFDALDPSAGAANLPLLGLFAGYNIPFEIDRRHKNETYPSLEEMARTAIKTLEEATRNSEQGFFLMIEGSRIDHAGHNNDPAAQVHEVLAYDRTFASVVEFLEASSIDGVLVASSDHETGGLVTARQLTGEYPEYLWLPKVLANASYSSEHMGHRLRAKLRSSPLRGSKLKRYINQELVQNGLGIWDASDEEVQRVVDNIETAGYVFSDMISRRAQVGWTTHGHSAVDVNIYGTAGSSTLRGNHENTDIGKFLRNYLDVKVGDITDKLGDAKTFRVADRETGWTGRIPSEQDIRSALRYDEQRHDIF